jgi:hypothetical protein
MVTPGVQGLAYSMNLRAPAEVAMVLPLPAAGEITFVDLSAHATMFSDLHQLFELPPAKGGLSFGFARKTLVVHEVGSFVASYVPRREDFDRLDPRFRIPDALFDAIPRYADYGFAVFQLRPGKVTVHPMGLTFPTRDQRLFFPTVHVHDGAFHPRAKFDHTLYFQGPTAGEVGFQGALSTYAGLVDPEQPMRRRVVRGRLPNDDIWIA